ncbi:MAG: glycosyltransferase family 2 protein [Lachnospiraceae bacterium]|nr:glycosyltransferase family 2 protein [Lachnospiraceae bacterium]
MMNDGFIIKNDRFSLTEKDLYLLRGHLAPRTEITAFLDGKPFPAEVRKLTENVDERFGGSEAIVSFQIPEDIGSRRKLQVYVNQEKGRHLCFEISGKELEEKMNPIKLFVDDFSVHQKDGFLRFQGWAVAGEPVKMAVLDADRKKMDVRIERYQRMDVLDLFDECEVDKNSGFHIEIRPIPQDRIYVAFKAGGNRLIKEYRTGAAAATIEQATRLAKKATDYFKYHGIKALAVKTYDKLFNPAMKPVIYADWIKKHLPSDRVLDKQRKTSFAYEPLISIVVPLYRTPEEFLIALVDSVKAQTYGNWELILSDGSGADVPAGSTEKDLKVPDGGSVKSPLDNLLDRLEKSDGRIRTVRNGRRLHIAENTNAALAQVRGDFVAFADHDDLLTPNALFEVVSAINANPDADLLYSDEDKIGIGEKYMQPNLKPDYDPDFLTSVNYICHLLVVRKALIDRVGMLDPAYDGAQDYDFILRCTEATEHTWQRNLRGLESQPLCCTEPSENIERRNLRGLGSQSLRCTEATGHIVHIPKILYHWRFFEGSTAANPESKTYAFDAGRRAIQAHYDRLDWPCEVMNGEFPGIYRTVYHWEGTPRVTILIPNKDHIQDLEKCLKSIDSGRVYPNLEIVIVENNSTDQETFDYYKSLTERDPRVKVVYYEGSFNYSAINNFGAKHATGEYIFLLNNDTEFISEDVIGEMLGFCRRPDVGAVGARLYYEDNTIQHAGVIVGWGGIAGHAFVNQKRGETGYQHRIICQQDMSAVTAACMMVKKSVFDEVGGLTEELAVAFNDIDFCMKIREAGYLIVYDPYAELYHYESKSRGLDQGNPEKVRRFQNEMAIFQKRWPEILRDGDPYYNPNLSMVTQDFSLKHN